jgi:hypothetical protein
MSDRKQEYFVRHAVVGVGESPAIDLAAKPHGAMLEGPAQPAPGGLLHPQESLTLLGLPAAQGGT